MAIEPTHPDRGIDTNQTAPETEVVPNPERGCGTLKAGKAYLRTDLTAAGSLPAFVEFAEPIPFKEDRKRSYKLFPGVQFELTVTGANGVTRTLPEGELYNHLDRLEQDRPTGETAGEMRSFHSHDLLMSVGKSHYPDVDSFVREAKLHGVNKAIAVTSGNPPPTINPGRTRLFLIHPRAIEVPSEDEETEYVPGIFGYTYLTRTIYTEDADGNVPKYIQDYEATNDLAVVRPGPEQPYADQPGFHADGTPVDGEQETLHVTYGDPEPFDLADLYPPVEQVRRLALDAPSIKEMERADLGAFADEGLIEAECPPEGEDAFDYDDNGALAVLNVDGQSYKIMPSSNVRIDVDDGGYDEATTVSGPYRITVSDTGVSRPLTVEKTR